MNFLKSLIACLCWIGLSIWRLPQTVGLRLRVFRRQVTQSDAEAERIDRIRHPEKYRGK